MKDIEIKAHSGSEKNGDLKEFVGSCKQYDTLKEADLEMGKDSLGHSKALAALNMAVKTIALNGLRAQTDPELLAVKKRIQAALKNNPQKLIEALARAREMGLDV